MLLRPTLTKWHRQREQCCWEERREHRWEPRRRGERPVREEFGWPIKRLQWPIKKVLPTKLRLFSTVAFEQAVCCSDSSLVILAIFLLSISSIRHQDSPSVRAYVVPQQCLPCSSLSPVLHWHFLLQSYGVFLFPPFPSLYLPCTPFFFQHAEHPLIHKDGVQSILKQQLPILLHKNPNSPLSFHPGRDDG